MVEKKAKNRKSTRSRRTPRTETSRILCAAKLNYGNPCPNFAEYGKSFCRWHDPEDKSWIETYDLLRNSPQLEQIDIILNLIEESPGHMLNLPKRDGREIHLFGLDLSPEFLQKKRETLQNKISSWQSEVSNNKSENEFPGVTQKETILQGRKPGGLKLTYADLRGIIIDYSDVSHSDLSGSNFEGADFSNTKFQNISMVRANLQGALLWETDFLNAYTPRSNFQETHGHGVNFSGAYLWETNFQGAHLPSSNFEGAILRGGNFEKSRFGDSNFKGADLRWANFQGAELIKCNFQEVNLELANLQGADLRETQLQGVDLSNVDNMRNVYISGAWLDRNRMKRELLGDAIGEELEKDYSGAKNGYLILKQNFDDIGDYDASSWAYRKERRMEKLESKEILKSWITKQEIIIGSAVLPRKPYFSEAISGLAKYISDTFVEVLCDYGESVWRVVSWIAIMLFVVGPFLFSGLGGVEWTRELTHEYWTLSLPNKIWFLYLHYFLYTLDVFTTANFSGLQPLNNAVKLASGLFAIGGITLAGLLGFVAGNRIRRS